LQEVSVRFGDMPDETLISSKTNARVKQLRGAFAGNGRLSEGLVAIEGEHLLEEAIRSKVALKAVFLGERRGVPRDLPPETELLRLADNAFVSAVETSSPQGIAALMSPPFFQLEDLLKGSSPLILVACALQDPGNLGALIRSAEAFEAAGILTTAGTVSLWNQKALRAGAGSTFRLPVVAVAADQIRGLKKRGVRLLAAVGAAGRGVIPAQDVDLRGPCAILIGNEGAGLSDEWLEMADARVTIPCPGPVESLNAAVAGSLLLYEASRQRGASKEVR
jgi:RNA methyltransferase, TrmH family